MRLEGKSIFIDVEETGRFTIYDKIVDVEWNMGEDFLFARLYLDDGERIDIDRFELKEMPNSIILSYENPEKEITFRASLRLILPGDKFDLIINTHGNRKIKHIEFLKGAFPVEEDMGGFYLLPIGFGRLVFSHTHIPSGPLSCDHLSMFMYGVINDSSLLLSIWDDPSLALSLSSEGKAVTSEFITCKIPQRVQFRIIPEGDIISIAKRYREYVTRKGYLLPWEEKGKGREEVLKFLRGMVFEIENKEDKELISFIHHLKEGMGFARIGFMLKREPSEEVKNAIDEAGYPMVSENGEIRLLEVYEPFGEQKIKKDNLIIIGRHLQERLLPEVDFYMVDGEDELAPSFFPLFEMVYRKTVGISEGVSNFSDIDRTLLKAILLGRIPIISEVLIPEGDYWETDEEEEGIPLDWEKYLSRFERPSIFMMGKGGWGEGFHPFDILLKNFEEIFIPFSDLIFGKSLVGFEYMDEKNLVVYAKYEGVEVVVNFGNRHYEYFSVNQGRTFLPPYGFIVSSDRFLAFYAYGINGYKNEKPLLVSVRTLDGKDFRNTRKLKIYHAFGPSEFKFMRKIVDVEDEKIYVLKK